jgi:outer membrane protein TolC
MSRMCLGLLILTAFSLQESAFCADQETPWRLREALKAAAAKVDSEDTSLRSARLDFEMLEALGRTRVEFRPQLNLLSFSNPLFLAASLGGSFSVNRRTAPSALNLELARFAVVEAELRHGRRRIETEIDTAREFFVLAEAQDAAARVCGDSANRKRDREQIQVLLAANRITKLDAIRFNQALAALESDCLEAKAQANLAGLALLRVTGVDRPIEKLLVTTEDLNRGFESEEFPESGMLLASVFSSREELKSVAGHIPDLARSAARHKFHFDAFSTGYSYIKNAGSSDASKEYLLGGNAGQINTGLYLPLRKTGEPEIANAILETKFDRLQRDLEDLKRTVRYEIERSEGQARLSRARLQLAKEKAQLASELYAATTQRMDAGLAIAADHFFAKRELARAEAESARVEFEWERNVFTILALSDPQKLDYSTLLTQTSDGNNATAKASNASILKGASRSPQADAAHSMPTQAFE